MAIESGLTNGCGKANKFTCYFWNEAIESKDSGTDFFEIRPHFLKEYPYTNKKTLALSNYLMATWTSVQEIDAIIAETMVSGMGIDFRKNYPQVWNKMLSQWGYFNLNKFKLNLDNFPGTKPGNYKSL